MMNVNLRAFHPDDFQKVLDIYDQGIKTGIATFETQLPNWLEWHSKYVIEPRIVAVFEQKVVGFAVLSQVSNRAVYKGVAEVSVYVEDRMRGHNVGKQLLLQLINESEAKGFWTLQAGIFIENKASINLHKSCGFKIVGTREKIGKLNNTWFDNILLEKRSNNLKK